jgi:hypothetical protein
VAVKFGYFWEDMMTPDIFDEDLLALRDFGRVPVIFIVVSEDLRLIAMTELVN